MSTLNFSEPALTTLELPARPGAERRAVRAACEAALAEELLEAAMTLWDNTSGESPARFARRCAGELGLNREEAKHLCRALSRQGLGEPGMDKHFAGRLSSLLTPVWNLRKSVIPHAYNLAPEAKRMMLDWAAADTPKLSVPPLGEYDRHEVLACVQNWLESYFGPGAAKAMIARAEEK